MHALNHEVTISASPAVVYEALTTADGLASWHTAGVNGDAEVGALWNLGSDPALTWEIVDMQRDSRVEWRCTEGPGKSAGTFATFMIDPFEDGRTSVSLLHDGWASTDYPFAECDRLWGGLLDHLKRYVETSESDPMFV